MKAHGTVHKYGDNVDTDVIIPARYLNTADPAELAKNCKSGIDGLGVTPESYAMLYRRPDGKLQSSGELASFLSSIGTTRQPSV